MSAKELECEPVVSKKPNLRVWFADFAQLAKNLTGAIREKREVPVEISYSHLLEKADEAMEKETKEEKEKRLKEVGIIIDKKYKRARKVFDDAWPRMGTCPHSFKPEPPPGGVRPDTLCDMCGVPYHARHRAEGAENVEPVRKNALLDGMEEIYASCMEIARKKNHDYAGDVDPLANFRTFGWKGVIVRISDKWQRVVNFTKKETFAVEDEQLEDTLQDMINYCAIALVMHREETKQKK